MVGALIALGVSIAGMIAQAAAAKKAANASGAASLAQGLAQQRAAFLTQKSYNAQADLSDYNAAVARLQAQDAEARGELTAQQLRQQVEQVVGSQRAGFAAGNIDVGYGSTVDVQGDAAFLGELDVLTARTNAAREAWGYKVQAADLSQQAKITRQEGRTIADTGILAGQTGAAAAQAASSAGTWGAATTLLSGAGSLLMNRYGFSSSSGASGSGGSANARS